MSNNTLLGTLPDLGGMTNAQEIKLGTNFFTGEIPESVGQLRRLQVLDLSVNFLRGDIPDAIGNVESLVILKLGENANQEPFSGFSGALPLALSNLKNLARLELYSNRFTGELPPQWGGLEKLQLLDLEFNGITGQIPAEWGGMTSLQEMYISNTEVEGSVPEDVCISTLQFFVVDCDVACTCCSRCEGEDGAGGRGR
jgi:Leucine-rich repeat (LRR) protein